MSLYKDDLSTKVSQFLHTKKLNQITLTKLTINFGYFLSELTDFA